jgi:chromate reductase
MTPRILAFAGSTRKESFNKKLVQNAATGARAAGAEVTLLDLKDFPLPLFDQDLEAAQGMPDNGTKLKKLFIDDDGLLIASPEYNSSVTAVLKNAIDWVSRPARGEPPLVAFTGKVATLMSASPGALGGLRGLAHVRSILGNIGVIVLPDQIAVAKAHEAFKPGGSLTDPQQQAGIEAGVLPGWSLDSLGCSPGLC